MGRNTQPLTPPRPLTYDPTPINEGRKPMAPRTPRGTFQKGHSGNPGGKPPGAKTKVSKRIYERLSDEADPILDVLINAAKAGDTTSARFIINLYAPKAKFAPVDVGNLPTLDSIEAVTAAHGAIVQAAASGKIDSDAAAALSSLLGEHRRAIETSILARKLERLERGDALDLSDVPRIIEVQGDDA